MKSIYRAAIVIVSCFTLWGAAGTIIYMENKKDAAEPKSIEALAEEVDQALGLTSSEHNSSLNENSQLPEDENKEENEDKTARETPNTDQDTSKQENNFPRSTSDSFIKENDKITESKAISLASDEGTISVDELLEMIDE